MPNTKDNGASLSNLGGGVRLTDKWRRLTDKLTTQTVSSDVSACVDGVWHHGEIPTLQGRMEVEGEHMRVLMLVGDPDSIRRDWAEAAGRVAEVVCLRRVGALTGPPDPNLHVVGRDRDKLGAYQVLRRERFKLPRQRIPWIGAWLDRRMAARDEAVVRYLEARHGPFDVIHTQTFVRSRHFPLLKRRTGIPYVVSEHDGNYTRPTPKNFSRPRGLQDAKRVYEKASAVICMSQSLQLGLMRHRFQARFCVIPPPIDATQFWLPEEVPRGDTISIISVGRLDSLKGHEILLEAFARVSRLEPRVRLKIVGDGPIKKKLLSLRSRLGVQGKVTFVGRIPREHVPGLLRESHFFALATRMESFGVVFVEAMACGLPIVATDIGPIPEIVHEDAGILAPGVTTDDLFAALRTMINRLDGFDRRRISEMALERYSYERVGRDLLDVYAAAREEKTSRLA